MTNAILLKIAILRNGMSVLHLCEKCGFSAAYFYKVLRGEQDFRVSEVRCICKELGIEVEEMNRIFLARMLTRCHLNRSLLQQKRRKPK